LKKVLGTQDGAQRSACRARRGQANELAISAQARNESHEGDQVPLQVRV
jgi:hypothetical protein